MAKTKMHLEGYVNVKVEDGKVKLTARWHDRDGNQHDCGFCLAPQWESSRRLAATLAEGVIDMAQRTTTKVKSNG